MIELGLINPDHGKKSRMLLNESHKFESAFLGVSIPQNESIMFKSLSGCRLGAWWLMARAGSHCLTLKRDTM